ncbi:hypothetical protein Pmani_021670 [Petrolisthes manimaculis]|uniref:DUF7153 domain-containing protein n=1 Tax=Petrolisthes manimaculis TaxID=1843537 RepID=A0AAE1U1Y1_9EUCA|nr:hypothetical protein Pmani_021670 [Petrolisthes manimaculis]
MQRNQLSRLTKEDLIESIMAPPEPGEGLLQALTTKLNDLVKEVVDLKTAVIAPDGGINKRALIWYPVAHVRGLSLPSGGSVSMQQQHNTTQPLQLQQQQQQRLERRVIGGHFTLIQDTYYEHTKLTLMLNNKRNEATTDAATNTTTATGGRGCRARNLLMLAYRSLEDMTDPGLLEGWVRWSGAWEAYTVLQEKKLCVSSITLYVRDALPPPTPTPTTSTTTTTTTRRRRLPPRESFKYVVVVEVTTESHTQEQQLRATTQRLRVERWSGYTGLYTVHTLHDFADSFTTTVVRIVLVGWWGTCECVCV